MRRQIRLLAVIAVVAFGLLASATPSGAQGYAGGPVLTIEFGVMNAGGTNSVTVEGLAPGCRAAFTIYSDPLYLGEATADAEGVASLEWTIPVDFPLGAHTVEAVITCGDDPPYTLNGTVQVLGTNQSNGGGNTGGNTGNVGGGTGARQGGNGSNTGGNLADTGSDTSGPLRLGIVLFAAGAGILLLTRKRSSAAAA